jgi:hypothetical protein
MKWIYIGFGFVSVKGGANNGVTFIYVLQFVTRLN